MGLASFFVAAGMLAGCDRAPSGAREWKASDHEQSEQAQQGAPAASSVDTDATLVEVAWQQNCARCHGAEGRGDGPEGSMVRAADLTRPEWQDRVSDEALLATIRNGRGQMPAFASLPDSVAKGLVARVRAHRAR